MGVVHAVASPVCDALPYAERLPAIVATAGGHGASLDRDNVPEPSQRPALEPDAGIDAWRAPTGAAVAASWSGSGPDRAGVFHSRRSPGQARTNGSPSPGSRRSRPRSPSGTPWGVLSVAIYWVNRQLPVASDALLQRLLIHVPLSIVFAVIYTYFNSAVRRHDRRPRDTPLARRHAARNALEGHLSPGHVRVLGDCDDLCRPRLSRAA